jgi:hypothetical protein
LIVHQEPSAEAPGPFGHSTAFHDNEEAGPGLLAQIAKKTGLQPGDVWPRR